MSWKSALVVVTASGTGILSNQFSNNEPRNLPMMVTVQIPMTQEEQATLLAHAKARGVSVDSLLRKGVLEIISSTPAEVSKPQPQMRTEKLGQAQSRPPSEVTRTLNTGLHGALNSLKGVPERQLHAARKVPLRNRHNAEQVRGRTRVGTAKDRRIAHVERGGLELKAVSFADPEAADQNHVELRRGVAANG